MITEKRIREVEKLIHYRLIRKFDYNNPIEIRKNRTVVLMGLTEFILNGEKSIFASDYTHYELK